MKKIFLLIIISMVLISCRKKEVVEEVTKKPVEIVQLREGPFQLIYEGNAELEPMNEVSYSATQSGNLMRSNITNGSQVGRGQLLIEIENKSLSASKESARVSYLNAKATYGKMKYLYDKRLITFTEFTSAENQYASAKAQYEAASDSVDDVRITADISGVVGGYNLKPRQEISIGDKLFSIVDESEMQLKIGTTGKVVGQLSLGSKVSVYIDDIEKTYEGRVVELDPVADSSTRLFNVKVAIPNPDREMKKGMYGTANIVYGEKVGLIIPKSAVVTSGVTQYVYYNDGGIARRSAVSIIDESGDFYLVEGENLSQGREIIVVGQTTVNVDEELNVLKDNTQEVYMNLNKMNIQDEEKKNNSEL